jgi:hypothetical protein
LPFQPYSTDKVSWGFTGLVSYALDPLYPEDDVAFHINLGYHNYNDVGEVLSEIEGESISVQSPTQAFTYGFGLKLPTRQFDYGLEFYGNAYIQPPPVAAYSREDYFYITPSVTYRPQRWISFVFALDYRLTSDDETTDFAYVNQGPYKEGIPNYPSWRGNLGVQFVLLPTSVYQTSERDILMQRAQDRRELFEQIIRERRQTESAEEELNRIKEERRKAERELERLRKILEDQARRKQELEKLKETLPDTTKPPPTTPPPTNPPPVK